MSVLVALSCLLGQPFVPPLVSCGCELSVNAHRPFVPHCSELCSPMSSRPGPGLVSSVQHQGLTEQWGEMWRGSDAGSCWSCPLEPLTLPAGAGFAPFRLKCERFITAPLWQFGTGKDFLCKLPWFYAVRILPPELDRAGWCVTTYLAVVSLTNWVNQKSNSKSVLHTPLQNCCRLRRDVGLILPSALLLSGQSSWHLEAFGLSFGQSWSYNSGNRGKQWFVWWKVRRLCR